MPGLDEPRALPTHDTRSQRAFPWARRPAGALRPSPSVLIPERESVFRNHLFPQRGSCLLRPRRERQSLGPLPFLCTNLSGKGLSSSSHRQLPRQAVFPRRMAPRRTPHLLRTWLTSRSGRRMGKGYRSIHNLGAGGRESTAGDVGRLFKHIAVTAWIMETN